MIVGINEEDKEILRDMIELGQWQIVLKLADKAVRNLEIRLLNANLADGKEEVWVRKAQLDGGQTVKKLLESVQSELRGRKK